MRRWALPGLALLLVVSAAVVVGGRADGRRVGSAEVDRLLIVTLPGVGWDDLQSHDLPNLEAFVDKAAVGDLSTRIGRARASTTDAYLSMGAGTRSVAPSVEVAVALDPDETYAGVSTSDILERRLGRVPSGVAYLAAGAAIDVNRRSSFGGEPGLLGDSLAEAGVARAVIANADAAEGFVSEEPPPDGAYARGAATALMGSDGIVPGGTVGRALLQDDPAAPFGRRLDPRAVLAAFDAAWPESGRAVVLVEASDLSRAAAYGPRANSDQRRALRSRALADSDRLLGELLARTDPDHDAVLVVSPVSRRASPELAVVALQAPAVRGGVLRSATTRRDGYVQLADVAPTVLSLFGATEPESIEGRPFQVSSRPAAGRTQELAAEADAAGFRDELMPVVVPVVIAALALLVAAVRFRRRLPAASGPALRAAALVALAVVPATFAAAQVESVVGSTPGYLGVVGIVTLLLGSVWVAVDRWRPGLGAISGLSAIVALFSIDVLLGAPLQVNAVFGYSVAVAGRFAGIGNLAFSLFGAATIVLAALLVDRYGRRAWPSVAALLAAVVLLEGLPMLGADVGGVLSMVPAFGVTALLLLGRRLRPITMVGLGALAGGVVLVCAFIDRWRPAGEQTHLARLAGHLLDGRWGSFNDSLVRRLQASFGGADLAIWALIGVLIVVLGLYVGLGERIRSRGRARRPDWSRSRPVVAAAGGLGLLAAIGLVANDSSIAVPATMLIVVTPIALLRVLGDRRIPA